MPQPRSGVGMLPAGVWRSSALLRASPSDHLPASTSPVGASADDPLPVADAVLRLDALLLPLHSGAGAGVVPPGSPRPGSAASFLPLSDPTAAQNGQRQKEAFLKGSSTETRNSGHLQMPASPYQVMAGTVIAAALVTG